ncbi:ribonuclease H-like domain-containing protein [Tanacetum coccineum]
MLRVELQMSSAYHPQADRQTKAVNITLECYLSSTKTTPFEIVYGQTPPQCVAYEAGECRVEDVDRTLVARNQAIQLLQFYLKRAQDRMKSMVDKHSLAGALQYLTFTRPDISYAVQHVCLFMHNPQEPHLSALKRILRYVRGTLSYGLQLYSSTTSSLMAYSDADWAGCPTTHRSTSGYCVFLGKNLLSWSLKLQFTLSRSSAEAEYRGVANAVAETCWLRNLLRELHTPLATATLVYCDNVSAVYLSSNPVQHQRTKHIEIDIHFVRDLVATGVIRVLHVPSRYQYADIFTKGLPTSLFDEFRTSLNVRSSPVQTAGEC